MASSLDPEEGRRAGRRDRVMLGPLPPDFLALSTSTRGGGGGGGGDVPDDGRPLTQQQIQEQLDEQAAIALHQQLNASAGPRAHAYPPPQPMNIRGRLLISVMQAKLVKNYGMTRMDPYVRIHIGHHIYETPTDVNGAKNPKWNKTIQCFLPVGINQIYLEIYDECNFSVDELIAHANLTIPDEIFKGETNEEWYNLNGKQGDGKEGQILLVFSFMAAPTGAPGPFPVGSVPYIPPQGHGHGHGKKGGHPPPNQPPVHMSNQPVSVTQALPVDDATRPQFSEEDFKQLKEMFPNMDEEVVKSVYEGSGFQKDSAANALLGMID